MTIFNAPMSDLGNDDVELTDRHKRGTRRHRVRMVSLAVVLSLALVAKATRWPSALDNPWLWIPAAALFGLVVLLTA